MGESSEITGSSVQRQHGGTGEETEALQKMESMMQELTRMMDNLEGSQFDEVQDFSSGIREIQ